MSAGSVLPRQELEACLFLVQPASQTTSESAAMPESVEMMRLSLELSLFNRYILKCVTPLSAGYEVCNPVSP